jgi:hypothetical protein
MTRSTILACILSASTIALSLPVQAEAIRDLPLDRPTSVNNVRLVCTGIGNGEEHNARWRNYPVKLQVVGGYGQYLADENVVVEGRDRAQLINVRCDAPWVLMRLAPGHYSAAIDVPGARPKNVIFTASDMHQRNLIVRFSSKMAGREMNPARPQG